MATWKETKDGRGITLATEITLRFCTVRVHKSRLPTIAIWSMGTFSHIAGLCKNKPLRSIELEDAKLEALSMVKSLLEDLLLDVEGAIACEDL